MLTPGYTGEGHYKICIFRTCVWQVKVAPQLTEGLMLSEPEAMELEALIAEHMATEHAEMLCGLHRMVHE